MTSTHSSPVVLASIASLSGASETLFAAVAWDALEAPRFAFNSGTASVWINLAGGTAVANGSNCMEIAPGQFWRGWVTNAITVIGTAGQPLTAGVGHMELAGAGIKTFVDGIEGFVDGLETLVTSTNTLLTTQAGYLDGMEALVTSTNSLLTTQATYLDGLEALAAAATPAGANIIGKVGVDQTTPGTTNRVVGTKGVPSTYWNGSGSISNSTVAIDIKTAPSAGTRLYVTSLQVKSQALGGVSELALKDGAGGATIFNTFLDTNAAILNIVFDTPLALTLATKLIAQMNVAVSGLVYISAQGYSEA